MSAVIEAFDSVFTQAGSTVVLVAVLATLVDVKVKALVAADGAAVAVAANVALTLKEPSKTEAADEAFAGATGAAGCATTATAGTKETSNGDEPNGSLASSV
jgi:hypothetical protein